MREYILDPSNNPQILNEKNLMYMCDNCHCYCKKEIVKDQYLIVFRCFKCGLNWNFKTLWKN